MRACKCALQLWTGAGGGGRLSPVVLASIESPLILCPLPSLLSPHPITVQEPHEPKPVLQGAPKRHQEAQELRLQVPQGGKCLLACLLACQFLVNFLLMSGGGLLYDCACVA